MAIILSRSIIGRPLICLVPRPESALAEELSVCFFQGVQIDLDFNGFDDFAICDRLGVQLWIVDSGCFLRGHVGRQIDF